MYTGCTCNGNAVISNANKYPDHKSCQKKCKETNTCEYFGVWDNGHCMGWDKCGSCQSSGLKNEVYKLEACGKSFYLKAMGWLAILNTLVFISLILIIILKCCRQNSEQFKHRR